MAIYENVKSATEKSKDKKGNIYPPCVQALMDVGVDMLPAVVLKRNFSDFQSTETRMFSPCCAGYRKAHG